MVSLPVSFAFDFSDLAITASSVLRSMGYKEQDDVPEPVAALTSEVLDLAPSLCSIRGGYVLSEPVVIDRENKRIRSHGHWFMTKQIVTHQLRRSEKLAWFVCTAGEEISGFSRKLMEEGDLLKGYIVDVAANEAAESAMDRIQEALRETMASEGVNITNRYSPGYCGWETSEQKKLFSAFPENYLDVSLTASSLMIPMKSVSGVIGIGREVRFNNYTCNLCDDEHCIYRNKR